MATSSKALAICTKMESKQCAENRIHPQDDENEDEDKDENEDENDDGEDDLSTLVLVFIVIRHGDRTPDVQNAYPGNPYKTKSFYPYKLGEVTIKGQTRMYDIGKNLRERYDTFLGKDFYTDMLCSTSSSYTRCQMSLQALHAGLFPPDPNNSIPNLAWQAVPFNIIPFEQDKFLSLHMYCPNIMELVYPDNIDPADRQMLDSLQKNSGYPKVEYLHALRIYDFTKTCVEAGLDVPKWLKPLWPDKLRTLGYKFWYHFQLKRKRFGAGNLIKRITDDAQLKAKGKLEPSERKLYIYSGHDMNLQLLRGALNVWDDESVDYGAHLIFELHNIKNVHGFKVYYQNSYDRPKLLKLPECDTFVPLDRFVKLTRDLYTPEAQCGKLEVPKK